MAIAFAVVFAVLSPSLWCHPAAAVSAVLRERTTLVDAQLGELRAAGEVFVLDTAGERVVALIDRVFVAAPIFWEIPNYAPETAPAEHAYLAQALVRLWRGPVWGSLMLALALLGLGIGALLVCRRGTEFVLRRDLAIAMAWALGTALVLLALVPIAWQRYYLPLVPALCVWQGFAVGHVGRAAGIVSRRVAARR
jgi:hypothetical protein